MQLLSIYYKIPVCICIYTCTNIKWPPESWTLLFLNMILSVFYNTFKDLKYTKSAQFVLQWSACLMITALVDCSQLIWMIWCSTACVRCVRLFPLNRIWPQRFGTSSRSAVLAWESQPTDLRLIIILRPHFWALLLIELSSYNHQTRFISSDWCHLVCCIFSDWSDLRFSLNWRLKMIKIPLIYIDEMFRWAKSIQTPTVKIQIWTNC